MEIITSPKGDSLESGLGLIAGKQAIKILADPNGRKILDELLKHQFIEIEDEKIILTHRGTAALKDGVDSYLKNQPEKRKIIQLQVPAQKSRKLSYWVLFLLGSLLLLLLLVFKA